MYGKIIDFYDNYFKNYINNNLWLDDNVKLLYTDDYYIFFSSFFFSFVFKIDLIKYSIYNSVN